MAGFVQKFAGKNKMAGKNEKTLRNARVSSLQRYEYLQERASPPFRPSILSVPRNVFFLSQLLH